MSFLYLRQKNDQDDHDGDDAGDYETWLKLNLNFDVWSFNFKLYNKSEKYFIKKNQVLL